MQALQGLFACYLIGSLPFAYWITRWRTGLDIFEVGEGNMGARNVWHVVGPPWGVLTAVLDALKGVAAVLLARSWGLDPWLAGWAAVVGHGYPVFHRFRGGKGLATAFGVAFTLVPWATAATLVTYALLFLLSRNFHFAITLAMVSFFGVWLPLVHAPASTGIRALLLFLWLGLKRLLDHRHMAVVRARDVYWKD